MEWGDRTGRLGLQHQMPVDQYVDALNLHIAYFLDLRVGLDPLLKAA